MDNKDDVKEKYIRLSKEISQQINADETANFFIDLAHHFKLEHLLHPDVQLDMDSVPDLPDKAPELYRDRVDRTEKPADFIMRVYQEWLGRGLARPHLMTLDRPLYDALHNWLRKNPMPDGLVLPTKKEMIDAELMAAGIEGGNQLAFPSDSTILQKRRRLYNAARNRAKKE